MSVSWSWRRPTVLTSRTRVRCYPRACADWLPENHLAYFVSDLIDQLDLSAIEAYYEQEERATA